ncbi:MAG: restriction endonuclease [Actinobacteria bacterium]|nr:restriction endonuclease [Actinomycetota bacterium]MCL6105075.1 restriction endonuclease [Actinomycetota bacterium]
MTAMPTWQQFMIPVLKILSDGEIKSRRDLYGLVASNVGLTGDQRAEVLNSGDLRYENRISWAITHLKNANALMPISRAHYKITESGRSLLEDHPGGLTQADLRLIAGYDDGQKKHVPEAASAPAPDELDPYERLEQGIADINSEVARDLLDRLHSQNPGFFEQAVLDLLVAMGYGGADARATRTQLSNDGGIDGIIDQDILGLSRVYIQAKRYSLDTSVNRPDVQSFVGALQGQQANQGVFITTARFSPKAMEFVKGLSTPRVVLIDGPRLAELMIRYQVGVQVKRTLQIVDIDEDFFE